jgi:tRNA modification GTPase
LTTGNHDTIAAIATACGNAGVGIIRISGPATRNILRQLSARQLEPRKATLVKIYDQQQRLIDQAILVFFPSPNSFTGEDVLELQGHGGVVLLDMLLEHILSLGCRQARAGEFSERAFLNGKIDLTQAEAIADLIEGQTRAAVRGAMRSLQGDFSKEIHLLVEQLIHLRMFAEACLDFPDEEIEEVPVKDFEEQLLSVRKKIKQLLESANNGSILRDGFHLVLAGKPNAGKSSLLNVLTKRDTAIVNEQAGTTRDIIRDRIDLDGIAIDVSDTAGLRQTTDSIESEGIRRTKRELGNADRVLLIFDEAEYSEASRDELLSFVEHNTPVTIVRNKIDLLNIEPEIKQRQKWTEISLSVKSGAGIDLLNRHLKEITSSDALSEGVFTARRRHIDALQKANISLNNTSDYLSAPVQLELLAEDCRLAQNSLNEITGEFSNEDLLGKIFSSFCIGK